jgi:hypothetical protein
MLKSKSNFPDKTERIWRSEGLGIDKIVVEVTELKSILCIFLIKNQALDGNGESLAFFRV